MFKKVFASVAMAVVVMCLCSCGSDGNSVKNNVVNNISLVANNCGITELSKEPLYNKEDIYIKNNFSSFDDFYNKANCLADSIAPNDSALKDELKVFKTYYDKKKPHVGYYFHGDYGVFMRYNSSDKCGGIYNPGMFANINSHIDSSKYCRVILLISRDSVNDMIQYGNSRKN